MKIEDLAIQAYCREHSSPVSEVLYQLERETHLKTLAPQMLSGPLQGQFLTFISKMLQPKAILEIGTFTGYAAICLAQGLTEEGQLHTLEANPELAYISKKYFDMAGLTLKIHQHIGDAKEILPKLKSDWDLVFIDAGKQDYALYFDLIVDQVHPGGIILADNVLWSGKVLNPQQDRDSMVIHQFNQKIQKDERVEQVILPMRDGLMMMRKI